MSPSTKPPFHGYDAPTRETERPAQRLPEGWAAVETHPADQVGRHITRSFHFRHGDQYRWIDVWVDGFPLNQGRTFIASDAPEGKSMTPDERDALCALLYWLGSAHALPKETP